jgi:hypothetical protein
LNALESGTFLKIGPHDVAPIPVKHNNRGIKVQQFRKKVITKSRPTRLIVVLKIINDGVKLWKKALNALELFGLGIHNHQAIPWLEKLMTLQPFFGNTGYTPSSSREKNYRMMLSNLH